MQGVEEWNLLVQQKWCSSTSGGRGREQEGGCPSHSSTEFETAPDRECAEFSTPETVPESAGTPVVVIPQEASREPPGPSSSVSSTTTTTAPVRKYPLRQNRRPPDRYCTNC